MIRSEIIFSFSSRGKPRASGDDPGHVAAGPDDDP